MKITKSQVLQIIKEEAQKVKQEIILRRELAAVEQELQELNEVHAGDSMDPGKDGVHAGQRKPVFTKKGTHLVEDDDEMIPTDDASEMDGASVDGLEAALDNVDAEMGADAEIDLDGSEEMGEESTISVAAVKAAIESLGANLGLSGQVDFDAAPEDEESLDVDIETDADDAVGAEEIGDETSEETPEEESEESLADDSTEETVDECGDNMEEKGQVVAEETTDSTKMNEEVARWRTLAGIMKG